MLNTYKRSKYYAVNIRRGIIYLLAYNTANEVKNLNHADVIPVTGITIMEATTFNQNSPEFPHL